MFVCVYMSACDRLATCPGCTVYCALKDSLAHCVPFVSLLSLSPVPLFYPSDPEANNNYIYYIFLTDYSDVEGIPEPNGPE